MSDWCRRVRDLRVALTPTARLVLFALASHANEDGLAWPSVKLLCEETGLARSSIFKALDELTGKPRAEGEPSRAKHLSMVDDKRKTKTWQLLLGGSVSVRHADHSTRQTPSPEPVATSNGPRDGLNTVRHTDGGSATRTMFSPPRGQPSATRTGWSATRTGIVRHADSHLEVPIELTMKGSPDGGAVPMAPPPCDQFLTPEWEAAVRAADPTYVNELTIARERLAVSAQLAELGFQRHQTGALWLTLVDRWAATGERPGKVLREATRLDPELSDDENAWALQPLGAMVAEGAPCG